jgi:opacity protein-like surface antigen
MLWVFPAILALCFTASAQVTPQWELSGGYSYLEANLGGSGGSVGLNGGSGALAENLNDWFGGRLEFNGYSGKMNGTSVSAQTITYGPVFTYRKYERFTPFGTVQFGDMHASAGYLGISQSANRFAMALGGGADYNLSERAAIRFEGTYLMTRFFDLRQDNVQFSTGLVIRFGRK